MPDGILSQLLVVVVAVLAPTLFGAGLLRRLGLPAGSGAFATLAHGYVVGHVGLALATSLWLLTGQVVPGVLLPLAAAAAGAFWLRRRDATRTPAAHGAPAPRDRTAWLVPGVALALVAVHLHACLAANATPIRLGDEAEIWAAKAKVLYAANAIEPRLGFAMVAHADYPNLDPLLQVLAFAGVGRVLHWENRLPLQAFGVVLLLLLADAARRRARTPAAVVVLVAASGSLATAGATTAQADVPLAAAMLATVDALLRWRETGQLVWWRTACLAACAVLGLKNEGALLLLALALPTAWWWWRGAPGAAALRRRDLAWLAAPLATLAMHRAFLAWFDLRTDLVDPALGGGRGLFARIVAQAGSHGPDVLARFGALAVDPTVHRLVPLAAIAAGVAACIGAGARFARSAAACLLATSALAIGGYMLVFVGTHADLAWHLATAAARIVCHVVPVAALGLAMTIAPRTPDAYAGAP